MKFPPRFRGRVSARWRLAGKQNGAALIVALAFLLLLSAVVIALFATSRIDRQNASVFATGQETLRLADAAVNLVQGQIRDATIQPRVGWASQPGMIRAFDTSGKVTAYKLYSSEEMVVQDFGKPEIDAETTALQAWNTGATGQSFNALYADLNSPAVVKRPDPANPDSTVSTPVFPIADPAAIGAVEGFAAKDPVSGTAIGNTATRLPMPVKWIYVLQDGQMLAPTGGDAGRATFSGSIVPSAANPIVGRIAFWADDETSKLNINTASEGTFWDAPKATTWTEVRMGVAVPVQGEFQRLVGHPSTVSLSPVLAGLSANYQVPELLPLQTTPITSVVSNPDEYYRPFVNYYNLTPRISGTADNSDKSTKAGAQRTAPTGNPSAGSELINPDVWPASHQGSIRAGEPLLPDSDRLYATADELLFRPDRTRNLDLTAANLAGKDFFLTANSRAPETTIFGTPRISLWPQQTDAATKNVKDKLIDFCTTVGGITYSFQRQIANGGLFSTNQAADSPTADILLNRNNQLLDYIQSLSSANMPGFGGSFTSKWGGTSGSDKVAVQVFDMVRANTNTDYIEMGGIAYRYAVTTTNPRAKAVVKDNDLMVDGSRGPRNSVIPAKLSADAMGMGRSVTISQAAIVFMASKIENDYVDMVVGKDASNMPILWTGTEYSDGETVTYLPAMPVGATVDKNKVPNAQRTKEIRAFLLLQPYVAAQGPPVITPAYQIEIQGLDNLRINSIPFVSGSAHTMRVGSFAGTGVSSSTSSAVAPFQIFLTYPDQTAGTENFNRTPDANLKEAVSGGTDMDRHYPFISPPIPVSGTDVSFSGGQVTIVLKSWKNAEEFQRITMDFDPASFPTPQHIRGNAKFESGGELTTTTFPRSNAIAPDRGDYLNAKKRLISTSSGDANKLAVIRPGDVVLAMEWDASDATTRGDYRLLALSPNASRFAPSLGYGTVSVPYSGAGAINGAADGRFAHSLRSASGGIQYGGERPQYGWRPHVNNKSLDPRNAAESLGSNTTLIPGVTYASMAMPLVPAGLSGATMLEGVLGDWASGFGADKDGAFFPRLDSGDSNLLLGGYFGSKYDERSNAGVTFEPNRLVPSSGILGALISPGANGQLQPWRTLLFSKHPAAGSSHPGFANPPDHAFLDNFWMPVAEPYPISEPVSTAGKINLNFGMLPFTYIERSTGLRGALSATMLSAVEDSLANSGDTYKAQDYTNPIAEKIRFPIDRDETMSELKDRFANGEFFRVASEVSNIDLIPEGATAATIDAWWGNRRATSDTLREQPYTALLSRVTTKSNTFTVHYWVQAVRQPPRLGRDWNEFVEGRDPVVGEYRGSTTIERFLDPNADNIPDYTQVNLSSDYTPIDRWYRWRVLSQKQFAP